jgi:hypothetical protein
MLYDKHDFGIDLGASLIIVDNKVNVLKFLPRNIFFLFNKE